MIEKTTNNEFLVHIPWNSDREDLSQEEETWNDACVWALEKFGLPGHRFSTKVTQEYMNFYFQDEKDAIVFALRWL